MAMAPAKKKRRYQAPRIVTSEVFERLALGCNGIGGGRRSKTGGRCTTAAVS